MSVRPSNLSLSATLRYRRRIPCVVCVGYFESNYTIDWLRVFTPRRLGVQCRRSPSKCGWNAVWLTVVADLAKTCIISEMRHDIMTNVTIIDDQYEVDYVLSIDNETNDL